MQAGLVSQRLALRDIFTAGGLTRRIFVAVVHVSVTVQPTESDEAERRPWCLCDASRRARSNQGPAGASIGGRICLQMSDSALSPICLHPYSPIPHRLTAVATEASSLV